MDSTLLVSALNKIIVLEVNLYKDEANMLFKMMMQDETSVTSLSLLSHHYLPELEPLYLFGVFHKLKEFNAFANDPLWNEMRNLHPRPDLVATLCERVAAGTNLKILRLNKIDDLSQVSCRSLTKMVTQVEELELGDGENNSLRED